MIAVLPFSSPVGDTALVRLGQDLAATISASLDGVGDIRTADRLNIAAEFRAGDASSLARAANLARRLGAGSVLRGSLVQSGANVRLDVGLYSTDELRPLAQGIAITAHRDSMVALTDSVVWSLLSQIWLTRPATIAEHRGGHHPIAAGTPGVPRWRATFRPG